MAGRPSAYTPTKLILFVWKNFIYTSTLHRSASSISENCGNKPVALRASLKSGIRTLFIKTKYRSQIHHRNETNPCNGRTYTVPPYTRITALL